jgi:hypothetical protein
VGLLFATVFVGQYYFVVAGNRLIHFVAAVAVVAFVHIGNFAFLLIGYPSLQDQPSLLELSIIKRLVNISFFYLAG